MFLALFLASPGNSLDVKCKFPESEGEVPSGIIFCHNAIINPAAEELVVNGNELIPRVNAFGDKIYGKLVESKTDDQIGGFSMKNREQHQIPEHLSRVFINLLQLTFDSTGFKSITASDLKPFPQLKILQIINGKVKTLESDLFKHTPNLELIEFTGNQIAYIGNDILNNLPALQEFYVSQNLCIDQNAVTSEQLSLLAPQLNSLCVQGMCAAIPTTTVETTACPCTDQVEALNQANTLIAELNKKVTEKETLITEKDASITGLQNTIVEKNQQITDLQSEKDNLAGQIYGFCNA